MLMIRDITEADREEVVAMMKEFYGSPACLHTVPEENFHRTITAAIEKSPLARILVLEETDQSSAERITGYANLAITWNNEAGGIQVWFDELFSKVMPGERDTALKFFSGWKKNIRRHGVSVWK